MQQQGKGSATADSAASKSAGNTSASATKEEAGAEGGETRKNPTGQLRSNLVALSQVGTGFISQFAAHLSVSSCRRDVSES